MTTSDGSGAGLRERRKESTRRALVDVALRQFDERGYAVVRVEDVCAEVEVSPRTFFRYFPSKEQVLAEPIEEMLDVIRTALAGQPATVGAWDGLHAALAQAGEHVETRRDALLRAARVVRAQPDALASSAGAMLDWERQVRVEVAQRLTVDVDGLPSRLLLGIAMVAFRSALDRWSETGGRESARDLVLAALAAVEPGARALERSAATGG